MGPPRKSEGSVRQRDVPTARAAARQKHDRSSDGGRISCCCYCWCCWCCRHRCCCCRCCCCCRMTREITGNCMPVLQLVRFQQNKNQTKTKPTTPVRSTLIPTRTYIRQFSTRYPLWHLGQVCSLSYDTSIRARAPKGTDSPQDGLHSNFEQNQSVYEHMTLYEVH